jgi:hypothetical protein
MNYLKVYCNLIRKAENRIPPEGYTEKHHTFPKSIFGNNNRVVVLTAREHYIAHLLLEKICIKRYGLNDVRTYKMIWAHLSMSGRYKFPERCGYINSYLYEKSRIKCSIYLTENHWNRKIEDIEIIKIIKWYWERKSIYKDITCKNLSLYFNVSTGVITGIVTGRTWKHIKIDSSYVLPKRFLYVPLEIRLKIKYQKDIIVKNTYSDFLTILI